MHVKRVSLFILLVFFESHEIHGGVLQSMGKFFLFIYLFLFYVVNIDDLTLKKLR